MKNKSEMYCLLFLITLTFCLPKRKSHSSESTSKAAGFQYDILMASNEAGKNQTYCLRADTANLCHFFQVITMGYNGKQGEADSLKCSVSLSSDRLNMSIEFERPLKFGMVGTQTLIIKGTPEFGKFPSILREKNNLWIFSRMEKGVCMPNNTPSPLTPSTAAEASNKDESHFRSLNSLLENQPTFNNTQYEEFIRLQWATEAYRNETSVTQSATGSTTETQTSTTGSTTETQTSTTGSTTETQTSTTGSTTETQTSTTETTSTTDSH